MENWKTISGNEKYMISDSGRVKSLLFGKERLMKPFLVGRGYLAIHVHLSGSRKLKQVHQLVAEAFLGHKPCGHNIVVDHIDNNKLNNVLSNLRLITNRENCSKTNKKTSSNYTGVSWSKSASKWHAYIQINGIRKNLGLFTEEDLAANAYINALENIKKNE